MTVELREFSHDTPTDAVALLQELGAGDSGFGGTEFGQGELNLVDYLRRRVNETNASNLPPGRVPQTTFWVVKEDHAVGMLRMRHVLNAATRVDGGHIGYYIRPSRRRKGLATQALRLALENISAIGVTSVMLTTSPENLGSIRVIEENGGVLKAQVVSAQASETINQYWIELS